MTKIEQLLEKQSLLLEEIEQNLSDIKINYNKNPNIIIDSVPTNNKTNDEVSDEPTGVSALNTCTMPVEVVTRAFKRLYPNVKATVVLSSVLSEEKGSPCGRTIYPNNIDMPCLIEISDCLALKSVADILTHEYAHAICGKEAEHNQYWKDTANTIFKEAERIYKREMKPIRNIYY